MSYVFEPAPVPTIAVADSDDLVPVRRIFCVGRNYAAHAREMGRDPDREPPFFFTKPADAVVTDAEPEAEATSEPASRSAGRRHSRRNSARPTRP